MTSRYAVVCEETQLAWTEYGPQTRVCARVVVSEHQTEEEAKKAARRLNRNNPDSQRAYRVRQQ